MKELKENQKKEIKRFSKELEVIYRLFDWKWYSGDETPIAKEIEKTIHGLLKDLENRKTSSAGTGGITVKKVETGIEISWALEKSIWI